MLRFENKVISRMICTALVLTGNAYALSKHTLLDWGTETITNSCLECTETNGAEYVEMDDMQIFASDWLNCEDNGCPKLFLATLTKCY